MSRRSLEFEFRQVGEFDGRYLVSEFEVSFRLLGRLYAERELFTLDTGSPMTVLRWKAFALPVGAIADNPEVGRAEVTGWTGKTLVHSIPDVSLSCSGVSVTLRSAKISHDLDGHGFSLLGTDFLEKFGMRFSARKGSARLALRDTSDTQRPCVLGKAWARRLVPGQQGRKEVADV